MTDNNQNRPAEEGQNFIRISGEHKSRWKQIHHSWIFWVFLVLMMVGILYYIVTIGFVFVPPNRYLSGQ